ncbi:enoyl-CoA hydratase-related protein [Micromonospora sp. DPT]|uniref:enoyl-CoA hydratase-related protein n=1 Tax=Micromonospora sp. DPT TaxID=3142975 RepID=UPI00320A1CAF
MSGIEIEQDAGVRLISFSRPERRNAMDLAMFRAYYDALADADRDPRVRVVVVTGAGASFCAGAERALLDDLRGPDAQAALLDGLGHPPHLPLTLGVPLIAAVNGSAAGLGLVHALYADLRFAAEHAQFSTVFARLGLVAEYGAAWLLPRLVGPGHALDLLLSARKLSADEAREIGLVHRVLPREEVLPAALAYARTLAEQCSPASLSVIRQQVWRGLTQDAADAVRESVLLMSRSFDSPDFQEAVQAMRERRRPSFPPRQVHPSPEPAGADALTGVRQG